MTPQDGPVLVTGAAGFIGFHVVQRLLRDGWQVIGIDTLNDYYDPALKQARLDLLTPDPAFTFLRIDIADAQALEQVFARHRPPVVIHLAAQPGVRYSVSHPQAYTTANLVGFQNILEGCRHHGAGHLIYASSSSVYGANRAMPFAVTQNVDHPLSLYAATKKANELSAHAYSHLYRLPTTGLRFFTVYGPWGRPDMATYLFADAICSGQPVSLFNHGDMRRDFTFVDDIVESLVRLIPLPAAPNPAWDGQTPDPASSTAPYRIYNIGSNSPVEVRHVLSLLEHGLERKAEIALAPMQPGDVPATWADTDALAAATGYTPDTSIEDGIASFVAWYRSYHNV